MTAPAPKPKFKDETPETPLFTGTGRLAERFYEIAPFYGMGDVLAVNGLNSPVGSTGIRVLENHGYLSKILIGTLMAMGQSDRKYVGSTYGYNYRIDYYRSLTPEERRAQAEAMKAAINSEYVMELAVHTAGLWSVKPGVTQGRGFEFYLGGETSVSSESLYPTILQIAFAMSHVKTDDAEFKAGEGPHGDTISGPAGVLPQIHKESLYYTNVGLMLRLYVPITSFLEVYAHWDANILSLFDLGGKNFKEKGYVWTSPFRAGVILNLTDRAYIRGHGTVNGFGAYGLGWHGEAGVRF